MYPILRRGEPACSPIFCALTVSLLLGQTHGSGIVLGQTHGSGIVLGQTHGSAPTGLLLLCVFVYMHYPFISRIAPGEFISTFKVFYPERFRVHYSKIHVSVQANF